jgi:phosphoribosylaminoimidazole-succinocarboxamide synthase
MSLANLALAKTDDLPIRHEGDVHNGKVRSVYWLTQSDSTRIIENFNLDCMLGDQLGVMVISDRISAFNVNWKAEDDLGGVPGKGASLNAISKFWFDKFKEADIGNHHILATPHPLVWLVQKADPVMVEAIARKYITGSMWSDYEKGVRNFCGIDLPDGLEKNQILEELLITPTTKGILRGIPGVPEKDDTNITRKQIVDNYKKFGFRTPEDVTAYENILFKGFNLISDYLSGLGEIFVDTKFELGYVPNPYGFWSMILIDEVGTQDSSRMWDAKKYEEGEVIENSKEEFRQFLLDKFGSDILRNPDRAEEKKELAKKYRVPVAEFEKVTKKYTDMAEKVTGNKMPDIIDARTEILDALATYKITN